jgi:peroxiredoxin
MAARRPNQLARSGSRAPDFRLPLLEGGEVSLGELTSRGPVLLAFFKITCPVCQYTLPYLDRIHTSGALPVYAVSQNDPEDTREFKRQFGLNMPMLLDPEDAFPTSNAYGISTVPTMFLVEPDGSILRVIEGWVKREIEWLAAKAGVTPFRQGERVSDWKAG